MKAAFKNRCALLLFRFLVKAGEGHDYLLISELLIKNKLSLHEKIHAHIYKYINVCVCMCVYTCVCVYTHSRVLRVCNIQLINMSKRPIVR